MTRLSSRRARADNKGFFPKKMPFLKKPALSQRAPLEANPVSRIDSLCQISCEDNSVGLQERSWRQRRFFEKGAFFKKLTLSQRALLEANRVARNDSLCKIWYKDDSVGLQERSLRQCSFLKKTFLKKLTLSQQALLEANRAARNDSLCEIWYKDVSVGLQEGSWRQCRFFKKGAFFEKIHIVSTSAPGGKTSS